MRELVQISMSSAVQGYPLSNIRVLWVIMSCNLADRYRRFEGTCGLRNFNKLFTAKNRRRHILENLNVRRNQEYGDNPRTKYVL
jgi:hypothetical protein